MGLGSKFIIALLAVVLLPSHWLLFNNGPAGVAATPIDIGALRRAAQAVPGRKPDAIQFEIVAARLLSGGVMVAGTGLKREPVALSSFRLVSPDGDIVIDSGPSSATARENGFPIFDDKAARRVAQAIGRARQVVFTNEDTLHVDALLQSPDFDRVASKVAITRPQYPSIAMRVWADNHDNLRRIHAPLAAAAITPLAPGVALMRAPGASVGSQMVFVTLSDGREYLFCGDVAPMRDNLLLGRAPSRLLTDWIMPEDRGAVKGWLSGLAALAKAEPGLTVVFPHDYGWLTNTRIGPQFGRFFSNEGARSGT